MSFTPNMGSAHRLFYVVAGIAAVVAAALAPLERPWPAVLLIAGAAAVVEGAAGF